MANIGLSCINRPLGVLGMKEGPIAVSPFGAAFLDALCFVDQRYALYSDHSQHRCNTFAP